MEYSFYIKGSHRTTTVSGDTILSAARDAAWLLNVADHEQLLWLPPSSPWHARSEPHHVAASTEVASVPDAQHEEAVVTTIMLDSVSIGRACFPLFLEHASTYWQTWQQGREADREVRLRYVLMVCGAIYALTSAETLKQVQTHLLTTSETPPEILPPAFDVALRELVSLQPIFNAPYERRAFFLFLEVLAYACLAVPLEQSAMNRLRECLFPIEMQCAMRVYEAEAEQEV